MILGILSLITIPGHNSVMRTSGGKWVAGPGQNSYVPGALGCGNNM